MSTTTTCPHCNAVLDLPAGARAGQSIDCPRCDEPFKLLRDHLTAAPGDQGATPWTQRPAGAYQETPPVPVADLSRRPMKNRTVGALVVLGMFVMAGVGLALALATQKQRRSHDAGIPSRMKRPRQIDDELLPGRPAWTRPLDYAALRYLPGGTDVVLAVHTAEVLRDPAGRKALQTPLPGGSTVEALVLQRLEQTTGMKLDEIDHVAVGMRVGGREAFPRTVVVVRTRRPYNEKALRNKLGAVDHPEARKEEPVYRFKGEVVPPLSDGLLSCPDDQTFAMGWSVTSVRDMPRRAAADLDHLPREMVSLLHQRMVPPGPVWMAGHSDDWLKALSLAILALKPTPEEKATLAKLRTFAAWVDLEGEMALWGAVRCADEEGAELAEKYVRSRVTAKERLTLVREKEWLTVQYRP